MRKTKDGHTLKEKMALKISDSPLSFERANVEICETMSL